MKRYWEGARLPFGEGLLVHANEQGAGTEVLIVPGEAVEVPQTDATRMVLRMPPMSPYVQLLDESTPVQWAFRYE